MGNPVEEMRECNASVACADADVDCQWGDWEDWGQCNHMLGEKTRTRRVRQPKMGLGLDCEGERRAVASCSRTCKEQTFYCVWTDWLSWGACSETCGTRGRRTRRRSLGVRE